MIDWDRVAELKEEVGEEDFEEIVTLFLEEVDGTIAGLGRDGVPASLANDLHFLKGSALNLGFAALGARCAEDEQRAKAGQAVQVDIAEVRRIYAASRAAFLSATGLAAA